VVRLRSPIAPGAVSRLFSASFAPRPSCRLGTRPITPSAYTRAKPAKSPSTDAPRPCASRLLRSKAPSSRSSTPL
jgi:hypothetical protein